MAFVEPDFLSEGIEFNTGGTWLRVPAGGRVNVLFLTTPTRMRMEFKGEIKEPLVSAVYHKEEKKVKLLEIKSSVGTAIQDSVRAGMKFSSTLFQISRQGSGQFDTRYSCIPIPIPADKIPAALEQWQKEGQELIASGGKKKASGATNGSPSAPSGGGVEVGPDVVNW